VQYYEGASNLYGPRTLEFVSAVASDLAHRVTTADVVDLAAGPREFHGLVRRYLPARLPPSSGHDRWTGRPIFFEADQWEDAYWEMRWCGPPPGGLDWDQPLARVEREDGDGNWVTAVDPTGPVTDAGWHMGIFHLGPQEDGSGRHLYAARWYQPPLGAPGRHRFLLEANRGEPETAGRPFD
jgi:hypothetical protein